jgi:hypothetical protein
MQPAIISTLLAAGLSLLLWSAPSPALLATCPGDCDADGEVTVDELIQAVNIALGNSGNDICANADANRDGDVTIDEILSAVNALLYGCPQAGPTATASPTEVVATPTATPTTALDPQNPPASATALLTWLRAGVYKSWHAESDRHASGGPHGGSVRTFLNDAVFDSLTAGNAAHPHGAAVVKELYFNTETVQNWAVEIKLEDNSNGGRNWYWYEGLNLADRGLTVCTGCHGNNYRGYVTKDLVLTPFPLQ